MKNSRGFTIIELLVVISVISIILGVIIPRFKGMQDEANKAKAEAELKTLQTAVESWFINHSPHAYPPGSETICADYLNQANPVIVGTPLYDPFKAPGVEYFFVVSPTNGEYYAISSYGPNGEAEIEGISDEGYLDGDQVDDIFVTNGFGFQ